MGILDNFSNIYDYFGDFSILSTELKKNIFEFFGLNREDYCRVAKFILGLDEESLLGMSNSDYVNEEASTSSVESEKNIYCSNNGQQSNGQQSNGQQSNGQQYNGQQSNGQQSNGQQSNGQQSNGQGHAESSDFHRNIARRGPIVHHMLEAARCVRENGDHQ